MVDKYNIMVYSDHCLPIERAADLVVLTYNDEDSNDDHEKPISSKYKKPVYDARPAAKTSYD